MLTPSRTNDYHLPSFLTHVHRCHFGYSKTLTGCWGKVPPEHFRQIVRRDYLYKVNKIIKLECPQVSLCAFYSWIRSFFFLVNHMCTQNKKPVQIMRFMWNGHLNLHIFVDNSLLRLPGNMKSFGLGHWYTWRSCTHRQNIGRLKTGTGREGPRIQQVLTLNT